MPGIQSYSMPMKPGGWVAFAAVGYSTEFVNEWLDAERVPHKRLLGCYNGQTEDSWLVHQDNWEHCQWLAEGEQAVLLLGEVEGGYRPASIGFTDEGKHPVKLGWFGWQGKEYALAQTSWTYDISEDRYYCVLAERPEAYVPKDIRIGSKLRYYPQYNHKPETAEAIKEAA